MCSMRQQCTQTHQVWHDISFASTTMTRFQAGLSVVTLCRIFHLQLRDLPSLLTWNGRQQAAW